MQARMQEKFGIDGVKLYDLMSSLGIKDNQILFPRLGVVSFPANYIEDMQAFEEKLANLSAVNRVLPLSRVHDEYYIDMDVLKCKRDRGFEEISTFAILNSEKRLLELFAKSDVWVNGVLGVMAHNPVVQLVLDVTSVTLVVLCLMANPILLANQEQVNDVYQALLIIYKNTSGEDAQEAFDNRYGMVPYRGM